MSDQPSRVASTAQPEAATSVRPPARLHCPRCGATVEPEQDWCLACGAPARTRLARTPNWRLPVAFIAAVVLVCGVVLSLAFVKLTEETPAPVTITTPAPGQPLPTTQAPQPATAPAEPDEAPSQTVPAPPPATETQPSGATAP